MLKKDPASGEGLCRAGDLGWLLVLEDRILLFDYKTDHYEVPSQLVERYRDQLDLYAEALRRSYGRASRKIPRASRWSPSRSGESGVNHGNCTRKHRTDPKDGRLFE